MKGRWATSLYKKELQEAKQHQQEMQTSKRATRHQESSVRTQDSGLRTQDSKASAAAKGRPDRPSRLGATPTVLYEILYKLNQTDPKRRSGPLRARYGLSIGRWEMDKAKSDRQASPSRASGTYSILQVSIW